MSGEWWQTKFNVSPGPGLWSLVLGPFGPDLGPDLDLTWDLDLDLSLTIPKGKGRLGGGVVAHKILETAHGHSSSLWAWTWDLDSGLSIFVSQNKSPSEWPFSFVLFSSVTWFFSL